MQQQRPFCRMKPRLWRSSGRTQRLIVRAAESQTDKQAEKKVRQCD